MFDSFFLSILLNVFLVVPLFATRHLTRWWPSISAVKGWQTLLFSEPAVCFWIIVCSFLCGLLLHRIRRSPAGGMHILFANTFCSGFLWVVWPALSSTGLSLAYVQELWAVGNTVALVGASVLIPLRAMERLIASKKG